MSLSDTLFSVLEGHRIVPVIVLDDAGSAAKLADALCAGGLPVAEVTFRSDSAEESLEIMAAREDMLVGAGTVRSPEQATRAKAAGAKFVVSPGLNSAVVKHCQDIDVPIIPGVATPTEIEMALEHGLQVVKFFPAEACGGVSMLRSLSGPYPELQFVPTGGLTLENCPDYLALKQVLACGGSWMVHPTLLAKGNFAAVTEAVRSTVLAASSLPG